MAATAGAASLARRGFAGIREHAEHAEVSTAYGLCVDFGSLTCLPSWVFRTVVPWLERIDSARRRHCNRGLA